jgi:very-short-patch-repair endonuclease
MDREAAIDHRIAELAARQGGVVSRKQLFGLGLSGPAIDMCIRRGRLHRIHQGVYAVGHRLVSARGRRFAALLAIEGSVLSHTSAGAVWDLCDDRGPVHVTVVGTGGRDRRRGLVVHRGRLVFDEIAHHDGLALTSPERTIARAPRRPGVRAVRRLLIEWDGRSAPARSVLEAQFLDLCRRAGLPHPRVNTRIEGIEVDFAWPAQRLVVEVDGFAFHGGPAAFERDRARDAALTLAGWRVLRFTWRQVTREPERVAAVVGRSMAR